MRLFAISMIRNEADILPDFLGHAAALVDAVLVVDHASADGTTEILAAAARYLPLTVFRLPHQAYIQSQTVTALAREAFARGADWVLPLDADEFPMVADRADLEARLAGDPAWITWRWRNLFPLATSGFDRFAAAGEYEALPETRETASKIAISRRVPALLPDFAIGTGSHNVARLRDRAGAPVPAGRLAHIPIRNPERFALKAVTGQAAIDRTPGLRPEAGLQWRRLVRRPERFRGEEGSARLRRNALAYPLAPESVGAAERLAFAPLGRLEGLPAGLPDAAAVLAREATLAWRPLPPGPPSTWRIRLAAGEVVLGATPEAVTP